MDFACVLGERGVVIGTKTYLSDPLRPKNRIPLSFVQEITSIDDAQGFLWRYFFMTKSAVRPEFMSPFSLAYWKDAAKQVYNVRSLVICAVLVAMRVALKGVYLPLGTVDVHVGFPINAVSGAICGPVLSLLAGATSDALGFALFPKTGAFMPLFTFIEMMSAFFYSICLYRVKITPLRLFGAKALVNFAGNIFLNSIAMNIYYGKGIYVYMAPRIAKNVLLLPVEVLILIFVFNAVTPLLLKMKLIPSPQEKMKFRIVYFVIIFVFVTAAAVLTYFFYDELYGAFKDLLTK